MTEAELEESLAWPAALLYGTASVSARPNELMAERLSSSRLGRMSQGKLTHEVPMSREARLKAQKEELLEGDELYPGAWGTKDAPGRSVSLRGTDRL